MVTMSRKAHPAQRPPATDPPEPGLEPDSAESGPVPEPAEDVRELYDRLAPQLDGWRVDVIDGSLIVSPMGTPEHQWAGALLVETFVAMARERGWRVYPGLDIVLPDSRHPYTPDFAMAPKDAPRWGGREVFTDGLVMVGEVVSRGSAYRDWERKPDIYAGGGVPITLLIDAVANPAQATVFSALHEGSYQQSTTVILGEKLHIPEPVDFTLDTSIFLD